MQAENQSLVGIERAGPEVTIPLAVVGRADGVQYDDDGGSQLEVWPEA